jgi:hypothetical protein
VGLGGHTCSGFHVEVALLPPGASFRFTVPARLAPLDRTTLGKAVRFRFETRRPVARFPGEDGEHEQGDDPSRPKKKLAIDEPVPSRFDVPVALEALRKALRIHGPGTELAFELKEAAANNQREFRINPAPAWPLGGFAGIVVEASLRGIEGPLPAGREVTCSHAIHEAPRFELRCDMRGTRCSRANRRPGAAPAGSSRSERVGESADRVKRNRGITHAVTVDFCASSANAEGRATEGAVSGVPRATRAMAAVPAGRSSQPERARDCRPSAAFSPERARDRRRSVGHCARFALAAFEPPSRPRCTRV